MQKGGNMAEWDVVLVIVVLIDLVGRFVSPITSKQKEREREIREEQESRMKKLEENTKTMTTLTLTLNSLNKSVETMQQVFEEFEKHNRESHRKLWEHNTRQDEQLLRHEQKLALIEQRENIREELEHE